MTATDSIQKEASAYLENVATHQTPSTADELHVALGCDRGYLVGASAAIQSLLQIHGRRIHLHLLAGGDVPSEIKDYFFGRCKLHGATLHWHTIERKLPGKKKSHLYRLLLPEIVGRDIERILYLDSDLVVLDDLSDLWAVDFEGHVCAAALDYLFPTMNRAGDLSPERRALGFDNDKPYVNTGVLLFNLKTWREQNITSRVLELFGQHHDHFNMVDQDALNLLLKSELKILSPRWNVQLYSVRNLPEGPDLLRKAVVEAAKDPAIAHFTGKAKPWGSKDLRNPFRPAFHKAAISAEIDSGKNKRRQLGLLLLHYLARPLNRFKPWGSAPTSALI